MLKSINLVNSLGKYEWSKIVKRFVPIECSGRYIKQFFTILNIDGEIKYLRLKQNKERIKDEIFMEKMRKCLCLKYLDIKLIHIKDLPVKNKSKSYDIVKTSKYIEYLVYEVDLDKDGNFVSDIKFKKEHLKDKLIKEEFINNLIFNFIFFISNEYRYFYCRNFQISLSKEHLLPYCNYGRINSKNHEPNEDISTILSDNKEYVQKIIENMVENFDSNVFNECVMHFKLSFGAKKKYKDSVYKRLELLTELSIDQIIKSIK